MKFTNDDSISPEDAKRFEEAEAEYYKRARRFEWRGVQITSNPTTEAICGREAYESILNDVLSLAPNGTDREAFAFLYALQGYSEADLDEDMKRDNFADILSAAIDMAVADERRARKRRSAEQQQEL